MAGTRIQMDVHIGDTMVDIDLGEVNDDDFIREMKRRFGEGSEPRGRSMAELTTLRATYHRERCRAITQGQTCTPVERDYWWHTFGLEI